MLSSHDSCLPGISEAGRPADPSGRKSISVVRFEAEGAADRAPLLVPLYRERRATGQEKPLCIPSRAEDPAEHGGGRAALRNAPDAARKPRLRS
jgi:hypothetical protein